jgi:hypothetical protein
MSIICIEWLQTQPYLRARSGRHAHDNFELIFIYDLFIGEVDKLFTMTTYTANLKVIAEIFIPDNYSPKIKYIFFLTQHSAS